MKNFLTNVFFVILVFAVGFLAVRVVNYQSEVRQLQNRIEELEQIRVSMQQQLATPTNKVATTASTEDIRRKIEQMVSTRQGMDFRSPVAYKTMSPEELQRVAVAEILASWTPQALHDYTRSLEALGLIPGDTDLTNIWTSLYDERTGAHYSWKDKVLYVADNLDLTQSRGRMILSRELAYVLMDQSWNLAGLLQRVPDNDDQTLAQAAFVHGAVQLLLTKVSSDKFERSQLVKDLKALMTEREEKLRNEPAFIREIMLFPYQEGYQYAARLEGRWQYGFQWPVTTEQLYHPEKARLTGKNPKDIFTALTLVPVDSTSWRLIGNNVLGEFGIRKLFATRLNAGDVLVASGGWNGDRYHVYERGINGPTGIIWRTIWDTESDADEFEEGCQDLIRKTKAAARIIRDGVYVTIIQSEHPSFDALAQEALRRSGVALTDQP